MRMTENTIQVIYCYGTMNQLAFLLKDTWNDAKFLLLFLSTTSANVNPFRIALTASEIRASKVKVL